MSETRTQPSEASAAKTYARCHQCSAPVDEGQRYCVACGARNRRARDPVAGYLALASGRARGQGRGRPARGPDRRAGAGLGTAALIALIPLAVAVGALAAGSGSSDNSKLLAALRAQKPPVVQVTGGGPTASTAATAARAATVASTFTLASGYAVELRTLAGVGGVAAGERTARSDGAPAVGVLATHDFSVVPAPGGAAYVLYSGQYATRSTATAALARLRRRFPSAQVIAVRSTTTPSAPAGGGQISTVTPKSTAAQDANAVKQISHKTGSSYVQAQNSLPGVVSVP